MRLRFLFALLCFVTNVGAQGTPPFIPYPLEVTLGNHKLGISNSNRIVYSSSDLSPVAELLAEEIHRLFRVSLKTYESIKAEPGDVSLRVNPSLGWALEEYALQVDTEIVIESAAIDGLFAGTATLLQAIRFTDGQIEVPTMRVRDKPSREFRAHMIDVKNHWHSLEDLKQFVDLCRFYKVRYLSLHTAESQWIGALTTQTGHLTPEARRSHRLYSMAEMEELVGYARRRGVYLLPHNECTPYFGHMVHAMTDDYNPNDHFAGFADELDGNGPYAFNGKPDERWLRIMKIAIEKSIDQFSANYSQKTLPYYHIGPVQGEGGMESSLAVEILKLIRAKSPKTKMMFWNGISATDKYLAPHKEHCVIAYYDDEFGASDMASYLKEDWTVVNAAWSPLYVVGATIARPVEKVFNDWNLFRQGSDGVPGGYGAIQWELLEKPSNPMHVLGGMLSTWETPIQVHLDRVRTRIPAFMEHTWHHQAWPYKKDEYLRFKTRLHNSNQLLSKYLEEPHEPPAAPSSVTASQGTSQGKVHLKWKSGGSPTPLGFRVVRGISREIKEAIPISEDLSFTVEQWVDTAVEKETQYYYWIQAFNSAGITSSDMVRGSSANINNKIMSYESFSYDDRKSLDGADGGQGWQKPWNILKGSESVQLDPKGLSYGELTTNGGSIRLHPLEDKKPIEIDRDITGMMGIDESTMWMSYLVRPNKVGIGDIFVVPNKFIFAAIGKNWGRSFAIYTDVSKVRMEAGKTYFVVVRYDFNETDQLAMWINPKLDIEPKITNADKRATIEIGSGNGLRIQVQGYGQGDYNLDELRFGSSWKEVGGLTDKSDLTKPNPSPMTWIAPPNSEKPGSIFMQAATGIDSSGVEYYFECVSGGASDSGWQSEPHYSINKLNPGIYEYRVKARDRSINRNETEWSFTTKASVK